MKNRQLLCTCLLVEQLDLVPWNVSETEKKIRNTDCIKWLSAFCSRLLKHQNFALTALQAVSLFWQVRHCHTGITRNRADGALRCVLQLWRKKCVGVIIFFSLLSCQSLANQRVGSFADWTYSKIQNASSHHNLSRRNPQHTITIVEGYAFKLKKFVC